MLTKSDLRSPDELLEQYGALDVPVSSSPRQDGTDPVDVELLRARLHGHVSVLLGHSGVGKSTLVNALVPDADRAIGRVNDVTGRGRHTSTSAVALPLPGGGWVVDTPGVRSFGLAHVDPQRVILAFPDLGAGTDGCPRGVHARRARVRPRRLGGRRATPARRAGAARLAAAPAAQPRRRRGAPPAELDPSELNDPHA